MNGTLETEHEFQKFETVKHDGNYWRILSIRKSGVTIHQPVTKKTKKVNLTDLEPIPENVR